MPSEDDADGDDFMARNFATLWTTALSVTKLKNDDEEVAAGATDVAAGTVGLALDALLPQSPANGE